MVTNVTTPVGRIVQGDPYKRTVPPRQGNQPQKMGADGQPASSYFLALAIPKGDPNWPAYKAKLDAEARVSWPQFFDAAGNMVNPHFANKITDGDGIDKNGKPNAGKEGFAGHWVVKFASSLPQAPRSLAWDPAMGAWVETTTIKCGDYVSINHDCLTNGSTQSPGMYMNPRQIAFEREGQLIVPIDSGPTANEAFGARGGATIPPPPGAITPPPPAAGPVMTPKAGANTYQMMIAAGWTHDQLVQQGYVVGNPASGAAGSATVSPTSPAPYTGYMDPNATLPPPPPADTPPPPPAATGPTMTPKAAGKAYQAFISAGWSHDQLVQQGYVNP